MLHDRLWTLGDVAAYLSVSVHTVRKWHEHGKIPSMKINGVVRFEPAVVVEWAGSSSALASQA